MENRIKELRIKKKMSAEDLMARVGWTNRSTMSRKENGLIKITIDEAFELSKIFRTPIEKIFIK